jgi:hypothetical protein
VPGPLPPDVLTRERRTETLARDLDPLGALQLPPEPGRGPHRGMITQFAGVEIAESLAPRVHDPESRGRTTGAGRVEQACSPVEFLALQETLDPVGHRRAADVEQFRDRFDGLSLGEPEEGLSPGPLLGSRSRGHELFQRATETIAPDD